MYETLFFFMKKNVGYQVGQVVKSTTCLSKFNAVSMQSVWSVWLGTLNPEAGSHFCPHRVGSFRRMSHSCRLVNKPFKPKLESGLSNDVDAVCEIEKNSTHLNTPTQQRTRSLVTTLIETWITQQQLHHSHRESIKLTTISKA